MKGEAKIFQTGFILWLQSFASDFWTELFKLFTEIGRDMYVNPLLVAFIFGVSLRSGFILIHVVRWNGLITGFLKNVFDLPRPSNVDSNVRLLGDYMPNQTPFESRGARTFFGGLPKDVVSYLRENPMDDWGFPSGHTSKAMALWGYLFHTYKNVLVKALSVVMIVFIPLSRIYLGRHFIADILGGYLVGLAVLLLFYFFVFKNKKVINFLFKKPAVFRMDKKEIFLLAYLFVPPMGLLLYADMIPGHIGWLFGFNLCFWLLRRRGFPDDAGNFLHRFFRAGIAVILFLGVDAGLRIGTGYLFSGNPSLQVFLIQAFSVFLAFWLSLECNMRLGLLKK